MLTIAGTCGNSFSENSGNQTTRENIFNVADDIFRVISYKEAAVLVSASVHEKSGIKYGYLPGDGINEVVLRSSDRALEMYNEICERYKIKKVENPLSTQIIRKLHLLAFGEEFSKKAKQRNGEYLSHVVKLCSPIRAYKALYKTVTHDVPVNFDEIKSDTEIDEKHEQEKLRLFPGSSLVGEQFLYQKYKITLENKPIGTVFKRIYYVCDKNMRTRKKSSLQAEISMNIDGQAINLSSPNKKVLTNIREWLTNKLSNVLKGMSKSVIEYKSDNRGVVFAAMPMITKLAQMNGLLARSPAGRDSDLINWIDRQEFDGNNIPSFPNRELLSNLIIT
jgi:hypothetical protein